jgi:hypothetical protein
MRKTVVVSLLALTLSLPAAPALAANAGRLGGPSHSTTGQNRADHTKHARTKFVAAGRLVSVDPAAGTLTLTVRGGRDKALRGHLLTVTVTSRTTVRRNDDAADLGDLLPGDHVNVKGTKTAMTYTATRVSAGAADTPDPTPSAPVPTATATPAPTTSMTPEPTPTTSTTPAGTA